MVNMVLQFLRKNDVMNQIMVLDEVFEMYEELDVLVVEVILQKVLM